MTASRSHVPFFRAPRNQARQVPPIAVLHHDVQGRAASVDDPIVIPDDVGMSQLAKQIHFRHKHLLLCLRHRAIVKLLPYQDLAGRKNPRERLTHTPEPCRRGKGLLPSRGAASSRLQPTATARCCGAPAPVPAASPCRRPCGAPCSTCRRNRRRWWAAPRSRRGARAWQHNERPPAARGTRLRTPRCLNAPPLPPIGRASRPRPRSPPSHWPRRRKQRLPGDGRYERRAASSGSHRESGGRGPLPPGCRPGVVGDGTARHGTAWSGPGTPPSRTSPFARARLGPRGVRPSLQTGWGTRPPLRVPPAPAAAVGFLSVRYSEENKLWNYQRTNSWGSPLHPSGGWSPPRAPQRQTSTRCSVRAVPGPPLGTGAVGPPGLGEPS